MFYLTTHSTHFIYGYMASVHELSVVVGCILNDVIFLDLYIILLIMVNVI